LERDEKPLSGALRFCLASASVEITISRKRRQLSRCPFFSCPKLAL
jgi:hypothetical protein